MNLRHELRLVLVALQFLTRVPVRLQAFDPAWLHASARHFPLIGMAVGGFGAAVWWAASMVWPPAVAVLLSMAATIVATGAFHEDGLADTCDGLGGAVARDKALAIMKDSRLGSYGAVGLGLTLALKAAALVALSGQGDGAAALMVATMLWSHTASRAAAVLLASALRYAGDPEHAKAKPMATEVSRAGAAVAVGWALLVGAPFVAVVGPAAGGAALAAVIAVAWTCARWFRHRLGGYTGDTLGATQQWSELAAVLAVLAVPAIGHAG
jgi:adenosylcobinamide-GDP ribazoletransferase